MLTGNSLHQQSSTIRRGRVGQMSAALAIAAALVVAVPTGVASADPDRGPHKSTPGGNNNDNHTRHGAEPDRSPHKSTPGGNNNDNHTRQGTEPDRSAHKVSPGQTGNQIAPIRPSHPSPTTAKPSAPSPNRGLTGDYSDGGSGTTDQAPAEQPSAPVPEQPEASPPPAPPAAATAPRPETTTEIPKHDMNGNEWTGTTNTTTGDTTWQTTTKDGDTYTVSPYYDRHEVEPDPALTKVVTRDKDGHIIQVANVNSQTKVGTGKILINNEWRDASFDGDKSATVPGRWVAGDSYYDSKADITVHRDGSYTVDTVVKGNERSTSPGKTAYHDIVTEAPDRTVTKIEVVDVNTGQTREVRTGKGFDKHLEDIAGKVLEVGDYPAKRVLDVLTTNLGGIEDVEKPKPIPRPDKPVIVQPGRGGHN